MIFKYTLAGETSEEPWRTGEAVDTGGVGRRKREMKRNNVMLKTGRQRR